jgi:hypothetical protein
MHTPVHSAAQRSPSHYLTQPDARATGSAQATHRDVDIQRFLSEEGYLGEAAFRARSTLEAEGLTRPGKRRLDVSKLGRARDTLRARLVRVCHRSACRDVGDPRARVSVSTQHCQVCGGSANRRAGELAGQALLDAGYRRLLVLGGMTSTRAALVEAVASSELQVRSIDGTQGVRALPTVEADLAWADVMVIWATTPLPHKVSARYTTRARGQVPCVTVARRGVEALCSALIRFCSAQTPPTC